MGALGSIPASAKPKRDCLSVKHIVAYVAVILTHKLKTEDKLNKSFGFLTSYCNPIIGGKARKR